MNFVLHLSCQSARGSIIRGMLQRRAITAFLLWASVQGTQLYGQIPVRDLVATIGPWECVDANGVHGILVTGLVDSQALDFPSVSILIYQRGVQNQGGYFSPTPDRVVAFDGKRLSIRFKGLSNADSRHLPAFDLDLAFDSAAGRWTGAWSLCNRPGGAVLERPRQSPGSQPHAVVGKWEGSLAGLAPLTSGTLQIYQSSDGKMAGVVHLIDARSRQYFYEAIVESPTTGSIVLKTTIGHKYEGTLSDDGQSLNGKWINDGAGGVMSVGGPAPTLGAPSLYRRTK
jgi:hypothetical protein